MISKYKLTSGLASAAMLFGSFAPAAFATEITIYGNGRGSNNDVRVESNSSTVLQQSNNTSAVNDVNVRNSTGGNSASGNTGGSVAINTGDAISDVTIHNMAGSNVAAIDSCNCVNNGAHVSIVGNGSWSSSNADVSNNRYVWYGQSNNTDFDNRVSVSNSTGNNHANDNTGGYLSWYDYQWVNRDWWYSHDNNWWKDHHNDWMNEYQKWMHHNRNNYGDGGNVDIRTGQAYSNVYLHNMGGSNTLYR